MRWTRSCSISRSWWRRTWSRQTRKTTISSNWIGRYKNTRRKSVNWLKVLKAWFHRWLWANKASTKRKRCQSQWWTSTCIRRSTTTRWRSFKIPTPSSSKTKSSSAKWETKLEYTCSISMKPYPNPSLPNSILKLWPLSFLLNQPTTSCITYLRQWLIISGISRTCTRGTTSSFASGWSCWWNRFPASIVRFRSYNFR